MRRLPTLSRLLIFSSIVSCGSGHVPKPPQSTPTSGDATAGLTEREPLTKDAYAVVFSNELDEQFGGASSAPASAENIVINLRGGQITKGTHIGESFLLCSDEASIPEARTLNNDEQTLILNSIKKYFSKIDPTIQFSIGDDAAAPDTNVVYIGGSTENLGCGDTDLKFRAPDDTGNLSRGDIAFVFEDRASDLDDLVTQTENAIEALLGIKVSNGQSTTPKAQPKPALTGQNELDSMSRLLWDLDPKKTLSVTPLNPLLNDLIPGGARYLTNFDRVISVTVGVGSQDGVGANSSNSTTPNGAGSSNNSQKPSGAQIGGGLFSWINTILGGITTTGSSSTTASGQNPADLISAIGVLAGHPEISMAAQILGPILKNGQGVAAGGTSAIANTKPSIPDYSSILGLKNLTNMQQLMAGLEQHASYVSSHYSGDTKSALNSLLVVGYSQRFQQILPAPAK